MNLNFTTTGSFEQELLKTIFDHPESIDEVYEFLAKDDFLNRKNGEVYKKICENYYGNNRSFDLVSLGIENRQLLSDTVFEYLSENKQWYSPLFILEYAEEILKEKMKETLINSANSLLNDTMKYGNEPQEIASYYSSVLASIKEKKKEKSSMKEVLGELKEEIAEIKKRGFIGMKTGIKMLDKATHGLIKKTTMTISAYTNTGKSALAYWITTNLLELGYKGLFFSLEVSKTTVLNRILSCLSGMDYIDTWCGDVSLRDTHERIKDLKLEIFDNKETCNDIMIQIIKKEPDFIVIDFLQNLDIEKSKEEYIRMTYVATKLQQFAKRYNIGILNLSQISNEGAKVKKGGNIIYSKGSGALGASADVSIELRYDNKIMNVNIKKNKFGTRGEFNLNVDFATNQFSEPLEQ